MTGFARWCFRHRKTVLAVWLIALVAFLAAGRSAGSSYTKSFSLPGTGSNQAQAVLQADFPAQVGDSDQIVMRARQGTLRTPAVEAAVIGMLAKVSRIPDVRSVASPYRTAGQISTDGTIGFATVTLDAAAQDVPRASVTGLISAAQSADSPVLQVELGGQAIEDNQPASGSSSLLLGVALALIVLFFAFRRSILGAVLPLISALAAIGIASPAVEALSHAMPIASFAPEVAILVALGVGVDYSLFVVSRHRSGLLAGMDPEESAVTALNTSGRAVLLAGTTVCVAILGLFALQVSFLYGVAVSVALAVALTMLASLTLLPAMLGFLGPRVLRKAERAAAGTHRPDGAGGWYRWARLVSRRAAVSSVFAFAVIVVLALPFFSMRLGLPDASTDPSASTTYQAYELLAKGFGPGFNGPLELVAQVHGPADKDRFGAFVGSLRGQPGVARVGSPRLSPDGNAEITVVYPATGPQQAQTAALVDRVRSSASRAEAGTGMRIYVGGNTALDQDFSQVLTAKMGQFIAVVVGLAFVLLAVVFRSLLIPLVASVMNLLSFGAALGVMTAAFQFGWGKSLLGFGQSGPIVSYLPVMMFAILFGLSTDYEVFLVSRMHEEWTLTGDNDRAVTRGQAETGRIVTAAALIMILVFASFVLAGELDFKQLGLGFAAAIFVDAFAIRTVLVPAVMHVAGRANWWLPGWLDRALPHLNVESSELPSAQRSPRPATTVPPRS